MWIDLHTFPRECERTGQVGLGESNLSPRNESQECGDINRGRTADAERHGGERSGVGVSFEFANVGICAVDFA